MLQAPVVIGARKTGNKTYKLTVNLLYNANVITKLNCMHYEFYMEDTHITFAGICAMQHIHVQPWREVLLENVISMQIKRLAHFKQFLKSQGDLIEKMCILVRSVK